MSRHRSTIDTQHATVRALIAVLDARAGRSGEPDHAPRRSPRRTLRAPCRLRVLARDGVTPLECDGVTRDISRGGVSFLCQTRFTPNTEIRIVVRAPDGRLFHLSGVTGYVRPIRDEWCHVGVKFRSIPSTRLPPFPEGVELPYGMT